MGEQYIRKSAVIGALEDAKKEAAKLDEKAVCGLETAIQILENIEPLGFSELKRVVIRKKPTPIYYSNLRHEVNCCPVCMCPVENDWGLKKNSVCLGCGQAIDLGTE